MKDMKARRILAVILSAAIFLCNVPITALAEELKEPPIQEANVIEEEPTAENVTVETAESAKDDATIHIELEKETFTDEESIYLTKIQNSMQGLEPYSEEYANTLPEDKLLAYTLACCKGSLVKKMPSNEINDNPIIEDKGFSQEYSNTLEGDEWLEYMIKHGKAISYDPTPDDYEYEEAEEVTDLSKGRFKSFAVMPKEFYKPETISILEMPLGAKFCDPTITIDKKPIIWIKVCNSFFTTDLNGTVSGVNDIEFPQRSTSYGSSGVRFTKMYWGDGYTFGNLQGSTFVSEKPIYKNIPMTRYSYDHYITKTLPYELFNKYNTESFENQSGMFNILKNCDIADSILPSERYLYNYKRSNYYLTAYIHLPGGEVEGRVYPESALYEKALGLDIGGFKLEGTAEEGQDGSHYRNYDRNFAHGEISILNKLRVYAEPNSEGIYTVAKIDNSNYCKTPVLKSLEEESTGTILFTEAEGATSLDLYLNSKIIKTVKGSKLSNKAVADGDYYVIAKNGDYEAKSNKIRLTDVASITPEITPIYNDSNTPYGDNITVSFKVEEEGAKTSSISSVTVMGNKTGDTPITNKNSIYSFTTVENDSFTITAENAYGNSDTTVISVSKVDKEAPLLSVLPSTTVATNKPVTLSITASDSGSGIKEITLPSGGKYAGTTTNFEVSSNGEYTVTATDNTGKEKTVTLNIGNLDFELPSIDVDISTTSTTKDNIIATVTTSDNIAVDYIELPDGSKINATTASFTITSNGSFSFKVVDKAGNENTKTVTVDNVDKDGPTIVIVPSTDEYTNKPVTLAITATDINGVEKITLPDGTEVVGGTAEYVVEKNVSLEISATDGLGSETKQEAIVDNIDTEPPKIILKPDTTDYVKNGVNVVITGSDNREVDKIVLEDGTEIKGNKTDIFVTENKTVKATVYDKAGNFTSGSLVITNIDSNPPTLSYSYDDTVTKGNVEVTVIAEDDIGVKGIKLPNGVFVTSTKTTFTADKNGSYTCTAIDHVGNETPKEVVISCIDRTAPTIENISISPVGKMKGLFSGSDVTVSAVANDNVAVDRIEYRVVGVDSKFKPYTKPLLFDMEINTTVEFIAYDTVGNASEKVTSDKIEVDKTPPTISYTVSIEDLTKGDVLINIEAKDNKAVKYMKLPNGELIEADKTVFTATENGDYSFIAYDTVGNASEELVVKIRNIDKELPTAEFIYDSTPTRESFEVTVKASDNKGIKSITLPDGTIVNSATAKFTVDKDGIYEVKVEDIVGNIAKATVTINNFDFEKPVITSVKLGEANLLTKLLTNKSVKLTVEATDDTSIATYEYKLVNSLNEVIQDWTNLGSASGVIADKDFDGNVLVRVTDGVGNISDESTTAFTLDVTPPTLTYELSTNMPTDEPVLVTIKASDNVAIKSIKLPNGKTVDSASANYLIRDNGSFKVTTTDTAGNTTTETIKISNIKGYGIPENLPFLDLDNDGKNDMLLNPPFPDGDDFVDLDGDGKEDRKDLNGDGIVDWFDLDSNGTNDIEAPYLDLDGDGKNDLYLPPKYPKGDDVLLGKNGDECRKDLDGDSIVDWIDFDGDGINDYIDTNGDGKPDWIDANGDGKNDIEKIFIDLDGDGINDIIYNSTSSISVVAETDGAEVTIKSDTKAFVLVPTRILDEKDILDPKAEYQSFILNKDGSITNRDSAELKEDSTIKVLAAYKIAKEDTVADNEDTPSTENNPFGDRVCFKIIKEGTHELIVRDSNDNEKIVPVTVKFNENSISQVTVSGGGGSSHTNVVTKEVPVEIPIYIEKPIYVDREKVVYVDKPVTEKSDTNSSPIPEEQEVVSQASSCKVINTSSWQIPIVLIIFAGAGGYFIGSKSKKREG